MKGEKKAFLLFCVAMVLFSLNFSPILTGNVIGSIVTRVKLFPMSGFIFLILSITTLVKSK